MISDPTQRFSNRVADYIRYRPSYPAAVITHLQEHCGLCSDAVVADVGFGTGIFAELLLSTGATVYGVEPNSEMRDAGSQLLAHQSKLTVISAPAEATTLPDSSCDIITAAQAFHWFDRTAARAEFKRILRPGGWVALVWNSRIDAGTAFLDGYERALQTHSTEYAVVNHRELGESEIDRFFAPNRLERAVFENVQLLDLDGLLGRAYSSSYVPARGTIGFDEITTALTQLFEETETNGSVTFAYETEVFYGQLDE